MDAEYFVDLALEWGADHAVPFEISDIVFDPRTILKCAFGCGDWGYGHTCPSRPLSLRPWEYEQVLRRYSWGIIIHSTDKRISQDVSFGIEREAFCADIIWPFHLAIAPYAGNAPDLSVSRAPIPKRRVRPFTVWALTFSRPCTASACRWILSRARMKRPTGIQRYSSSDKWIVPGESSITVIRHACLPRGCYS
jgi:hypothetical protein